MLNVVALAAAHPGAAPHVHPPEIGGLLLLGAWAILAAAWGRKAAGWTR